jgi:hypothetical protein
MKRGGDGKDISYFSMGLFHRGAINMGIGAILEHHGQYRFL